MLEHVLLLITVDRDGTKKMWIPITELDRGKRNQDRFEQPSLQLPLPAPMPNEKTSPTIHEDQEDQIERGVYIIDM